MSLNGYLYPNYFIGLLTPDAMRIRFCLLLATYVSPVYNITAHDLILLFTFGEMCSSGLAVHIVCL